MNDGKTILHADDVARWRDYVHDLLAGTFKVISVNDCESVLPRLDEGDIDLVVLDHLMPGTVPLDTGFEVCQQIRKDHPHLPIIVFTCAWRDVDSDREELERVWNVPVVFKDGIDPRKDDLLARISSALTSLR